MQSLSDRMKQYEHAWRILLPPRQPIIIRLDGKAFHTLTRKCQKPFDHSFIGAMQATAKVLCEQCEGAQLAYTQSDEISILLVNYQTYTTNAWFKNSLQKIVSVSAGIASTTFSKEFGVSAIFDSRAFCLPMDEVVNYFIWRQQDWERNSVHMLARAHFSHKQLHKLSCAQMKEKLSFYEETPNWEDLEMYLKRGTFVYKKDLDWFIDLNPLLVKDNRNYIERHVYIGEGYEKDETQETKKTNK